MSYVGTEAGLLTGKLVRLPNRKLLPNIIYQSSCDSYNLGFAGALNSNVVSGGIGLSERDAEMSTIGEFVERYSSGFITKDRLQYGSYKELKAKGENVLSPSLIKLYSEEQYKQFAKDGFDIVSFDEDESVHWIRGVDLKNDDQIIWMPAFLVFLPHDSFGVERSYLIQTSTGLSAGDSIEGAQIGGFLESAERNAFCDWWYFQKEVPIYNVESILKHYENDKDYELLKKLIVTNKIKMKFFDLSGLGAVNTVVCFMFFWHKGKFMQSMGCSSRFTFKDALIKAVLESYQGVELAIMLDDDQALKDLEPETSMLGIDTFNKHFAFYNSFPQYRNRVPIIKRAMKDFAEVIPVKEDYESYHMSDFSKESIKKLDVPHVIRVDVTAGDVDTLGFKVVRVFVPGWAYLTGMHGFPFLGADIFKDKDDLFTKWPHPFP
ncbi:MAG: YcaO-like family protein [Hyphomicrobiales bacterium]